MVENEEIDSFGEDPSNWDKIRQYCEEVGQCREQIAWTLISKGRYRLKTIKGMLYGIVLSPFTSTRMAS